MKIIIEFLSLPMNNKALLFLCKDLHLKSLYDLLSKLHLILVTVIFLVIPKAMQLLLTLNIKVSQQRVHYKNLINDTIKLAHHSILPNTGTLKIFSHLSVHFSQFLRILRYPWSYLVRTARNSIKLFFCGMGCMFHNQFNHTGWYNFIILTYNNKKFARK